MSSNEEFNYEQIEDLLKSIYDALIESKLPEKIKKNMREELETLKAFTLDARPARIAIVGRRGAGKSSLINAIFSEMRAEIGDVKARTGMGKWHTYQSDSGDLEILDTRGLGEADKPEEDISEVSAIEEVQASIKEKCPDAILFLSKAKEVSSRIDEDMAQLIELKKTIQIEHDYDVPIIGVVTQVDELSPKSSDKPPFDHPVKQKNIIDAMEVLSVKLRDAVSNPVTVIPISCYVEFEDNQIVYDIRWNVDSLLDYLIEQLPNEAQMILAKLSKVKSVQKKIARRIGKSVAGVTGAIGASPIPLADLPIVTGLQMAMVTSIALIGGKKIDKKGVVEFLGALGLNVAAGFILRQVARQLLKIIPVAGNVISGAIASAGTYALCEAAIAYFIDGNSMDNVKKTYNKVYEDNKKENENEK
ncbi:GTPase RsgA [Bacillus lacus]|uniref:GTPase RsgA n=1 Tax=Metabacillus lacus TaxID=1983721 RepID=A0A7X2IYH4_9BACI|nr:GTPase [Metabacillus lacus]MRX72135.1 GTPase RsgA [Metabacillus lacus]